MAKEIDDSKQKHERDLEDVRLEVSIVRLIGSSMRLDVSEAHAQLSIFGGSDVFSKQFPLAMILPIAGKIFIPIEHGKNNLD